MLLSESNGKDFSKQLFSLLLLFAPSESESIHWPPNVLSCNTLVGSYQISTSLRVQCQYEFNFIKVWCRLPPSNDIHLHWQGKCAICVCHPSCCSKVTVFQIYVSTLSSIFVQFTRLLQCYNCYMCL